MVLALAAFVMVVFVVVFIFDFADYGFRLNVIFDVTIKECVVCFIGQ